MVPRLAEHQVVLAHGLAFSRPGHLIRPVDGLLAAVFHCILFVLASQVAVTSAQRIVQRVPSADRLVFFALPSTEPRRAPEPVRPARAPGPKTRPDAAAVARGFQTVPLVRSVASTIPPINLRERPLDPRNYSGFGTEGGIADGVEGGTRVTEVPAMTPAGGTGSGGRLVRMGAASTPARLIEIPAVRYPPTMVTLDLEGAVVLRFVIDTLGRVEPGSIRVVHSRYPLFEAAARSALQEARFIPARLGTEKVRQLTDQRFDFTLTDSP